MDKEASRLEETYVNEVYENIASHFDQTRHAQWSGVKRFLFSLTPYSIMLDVGCGNGKYLNEDSRFVKLGCDRSLELCKICNEKGFSIFAADCLALPLVEGRFDALISIAVIHHLATEERRLRALKQMLNLLRTGGRALIYVWAFEQRRKGESSHYVKNDQSIDRETEPTCSQRNREPPYSDQRQITNDFSLPVHDNGTQFLAQDLLVPWTKAKQKKKSDDDGDGGNGGGERLLRFYHVFKEGELENLCLSLGNCIIRQTFYEQGNWCIELEKI